MPARAAQALRMQNPQQKIMAFLFVQQIGYRKTHHGNFLLGVPLSLAGMALNRQHLQQGASSVLTAPK
jgi:hypothetical protein